MNFAKRLLNKAKKGAESEHSNNRSSGRDAASGKSGAGNTAGVKSTASGPAPEAIGKENWHISLGRNRITALLDYVPRPDSPRPVAAELLRAAVEIGVPEEGLFSAEKLDLALRNAETSGIPLRGYPICENLEGGFEINVSDDKLNATLSLRKGRGQGKPLDLKDLGKALRESQIKNLNFEQLKTDILAFYRGLEVSLEGYHLASGKAPEPGVDPELRWETEFMPATELAELKRQLEDAPADAFEGIESLKDYPTEVVENAAFIANETVFATVSHSHPGKPGVDVYGDSIPANGETAVPLVIHENCTKKDTKIYSQVDGILERWQADDTTHVRVRPHMDAKITPFLAPDGMSARVDLIQGAGAGKRLHVEDVRQELITAGVVRGIDLEAVERAVKAAEDQGAVKQAVVAQGKEPETVGGASLEFHIELASGKPVTIHENGRADYRNQDRVTRVEEGTLIAEVITPETTLQDGFDVQGNVIKPKEVKEFSLEIGENIRQERDEQGRLKLFAAVSGELAYDGKSIDIVGVHVIKGDVGPSTGNVRFSGPVHIAGKVHPGFVIMAAGEIKIAEGVEAALLSSEKSIHVSQGIIGGGKAAVRAREEITAGFAEHVVLMAVKDISLKSACLQCTVKCNGRLSLEGERGHLVGGQAKARYGGELVNLGSKNGAKTSFSFGQDYLIGDKIELEEKELEKLKNDAVQIDLEIRKAEKEGAALDLKNHRAKKLQILKLIERRTERLFWLREKFEQHYESEVAVSGTAFPGVTLESHGRTFEVAREMQKVVFYFNQEKGIIENRPL